MPGKLSHAALGGCPAWRRGRAEEHGAPLAQTWPSLTRGCCSLLGPEFCLPGAAGEGAGTGTGSACPGFCGHPKAAKCGQQLAEGCRGVRLVLGGCLGEPVAILGVMLQHWGWASSAGEAHALTDHSLQVLPVPLWCRSHPAPQGEMLNRDTSHHTRSKTLNKRLFHGPNLLSNLQTALLEKSRSTGGSPTTSSTEPEEGMSDQGTAAQRQPGCALCWHPWFELSCSHRGSALSCLH